MASYQFSVHANRRQIRTFVFLLLCFLLLSSAQGKATPNELAGPSAAARGSAANLASPKAISSAADAEFFDSLSRGLAHYDAQRYRDAIEHLKRAYRIHPFPRILQNIGQAHRKMGEYREARQFLSMYLALEPSLASDKRRRIEQILHEIEQIITKQRQFQIPPSRPRWRLGLGIGISVMGALILGFGIPGLAIDGRCIQVPSLPGEVCARQYDTGVLGTTLTVSGGIMSMGGLLIAGWPASSFDRGKLVHPQGAISLTTSWLPSPGLSLSVGR